MTIVRVNTVTTSHVTDAILIYAKSPQLKHLRLAITKRYVDPSELPDGCTDNTLIQNSPVLLAIAVIDLSYTETNTIAVVIDSPGLTMRCSPRDGEVIQLLSDLLALKLPQGRLGCAIQPIDATQHLSAPRAAQTILAADYGDFQTLNGGKELQRRMGYMISQSRWTKTRSSTAVPLLLDRALV